MIRALLCLLLLTTLACRGDLPAEVEPLLSQEQLVSSSIVTQAQSRVSPAHERRAAAFETQGRAALAEGRYDAAAKAFGEAALYAPSAVRMLGCAASWARGSRQRPTASEIRTARQQAIDHASALLSTAHALARDDRALVEAVQLEQACLARLLELPAGDPCAIPRLP